MTKIHIEIEDRQWRNELDRLMAGPESETIMKLEAMLVEATAMTIEAVHVETGSLKSTIHPDSHFEPYRWQGAIKSGGAAPGMPRDPVYYAVFELARGHKDGRNHHYYEDAHHYIPDEMMRIIMSFFGGER